MRCSLCKKEGHNKRTCKNKKLYTSKTIAKPSSKITKCSKVMTKVMTTDDKIYTSAMTYYTICTEENPQINEISFIVKYLDISAKVIKLSANTNNNQWDGTFNIGLDNPLIQINLVLAKGGGSFVDYVVFNGIGPDVIKTEPILLLESTKTSDKESRNTAINQRFTKFAVAKQLFPNTPLVLYFNTEHIASTPTSLFGRRLLSTFGVKAFDVTYKDLLADAPPFKNVNELIVAKNSIKERKKNISVKIKEVEPHKYAISAKLSKGDNKTICHDPNKGLVTGIASAIYELDKESQFIITNHCVDVKKIPHHPSDKFWYANNRYELTLEDCNVSSSSVKFQGEYLTFETKSEKSATILFQNHMENNGWTTIYHNHSHSARSYFVDADIKEHQVPKNVTIPDIVLLNNETKTIKICEGKIKKDVNLGVEQLDNLSKFIEYVTSFYPDYTIEKGLCLYVSDINNVQELKEKIKYKIWFALDSVGNYSY
jgi:hypothetical protein